MENKANTSLDTVNVRNLPEFQGWKEKQLSIVKENPFVAIEDHKSYEVAKKHRTTLVSARTDIQKQDRLIASKLKEIRNQAKNVADELISITLPAEEKQQEEVRRYEAEREAERLEKERIERERKEAIQKEINDLYEGAKAQIKSLDNLEKANEFKSQLEVTINEQGEKDMEEFEMDFAEKAALLHSQLKERIVFLTEQEESRKERERLAAERAELERMRKEAEERKSKEEAERKAREEKELSERKAREEKERLAREEEERKIRAEREAEAEKLRKEREELEAEKKRIADQKAKEEAERQAKEEVERKAREKAELEAKLKAEKEAEEKRLEELKPDKEKLIQFTESLLNLDQEIPNLSDEKSKQLASEIHQSIQDWKDSILDRIQDFK